MDGLGEQARPVAAVESVHTRRMAATTKCTKGRNPTLRRKARLSRTSAADRWP